MARTWWRRTRPSVRPSSASHARVSRTRRFGVYLEVLEDRLAPALHCWTGAVNSLWSNPGNWDTGAVCMGAQGSPVGDPDAEVRFPHAPPLAPVNLTSVNDLGNITIKDLVFETANIVLSSAPGMAIRITGGIIDDPFVAPATNTIRSPLILSGPVTAHPLEFSVDFNVPRTIILEGTISADSSAHSLVKSGHGEVVLKGDSTFQGGVVVQAAPPVPPGVVPIPSVLTVGHDRALGIGLLTLAGGILRPSTAVSLANPFSLTSSSFIDGNAPLTMSGSGNLAAGQTLEVQNYNLTTFSNTILGGGGLAVNAEIDPRIARGKVVLSGSNGYAGATTVLSGILAVTTNTALGVGNLVLTGGTFQSDNPNALVTLANTFTVNGNAAIAGQNDLTITGVGTINGTATLTLANILRTITLPNQITGTGSILKAEAGTAHLGGDSAYSGKTTIRGGVLSVSHNNSLGTGQIDLAGGVLRATAPVNLANTFAVTGDSGLDGNSNLTFSGPGTFTGAVTFTLTVTNTAATTFANVISGVGAIRVNAGVGVVNFFGVNSYSGGTTLVSGTITVNSDRSLGVGVVILSGGLVQANAPVTLPNTLLVNGTPSLGGAADLTITGGVTLLEPTNSLTVRNHAVTTFTNVINGSGRLGLDAAAGTLNLPALNTYTGGTVLGAGTLVASSNLSFGTGPLALNGGRLLPTVPVTFANTFTVGGAATLDAVQNMTFTGFGTLLAGGNLIVRNNAVTTFTHTAFINITGAGAITKLDGGALILTSNADFAGGVTLSAGLLRLGHPNALGTGLFTANGGTIQADTPVALPNAVTINGAVTIGGTTDLAFGGAGPMTLSAAAALTITNTAATTINQSLVGTGALTVAAGTVTLTGANTHNGPTTVNGGSLLVNGSQPNSPIVVNSGSLGGTGTAGVVTVLQGTLQPGNSPGILRVTGSLTMSALAKLVLELNAATVGSGFDQLVVSNSIAFTDAGPTLDLRANFAPPVGTSFTLLQSAGGVQGTFANIPEGGIAVAGDLTFRVTYRGGAAGTDIVFTRVLTNSTLALVTSVNPANPGRAITFTATVAAAGGATGTPTGTVTFFEGANQLAVVPLVNGQASLTISTFTVGDYNISAVYSGDGGFTPAGPNQLTQAVRSDLTVPVNQRYVAQLYRDMLGREADAGGLAEFTRLLDSNQVTRFQVVFAIQNSQEYREQVVRNLYQQVLGREVDPLGLADWSAFLAQGGTSERLLVLLLDSVEFFQKSGGTNDSFLQAVYRVVLGRTVDTVGQQLWTARFTAGSPRGSIAEEIVGSLEADRAKVDQIFRRYLRRAPDTAGLNGFVAALQAGASVELLSAAVLASEEYYLRA